MKKTLTHPVFVVAVLLAAFNQILERKGIFIPVIHSYLDDFLCFPIVLTVGLSCYRLLIPRYRLTAYHIWPLLIIYIMIFEFYLPSTSPIYTADPLDVVAYLAGIILFKLTINQPQKELLAHKF